MRDLDGCGRDPQLRDTHARNLKGAVAMSSNYYAGAVGQLRLEKDRMVNYLIGGDMNYYSRDEVNQIIGAGRASANVLALMGLIEDNGMQAIYLLIAEAMKQMGVWDAVLL